MKFAFFPMALHLTPQLKVSKIFKEDFAQRFGQCLSLRLSCLSFYFQFLCVPFSIFSLSSFVFLIIFLSSSLDIIFEPPYVLFPSSFYPLVLCWSFFSFSFCEFNSGFQKFQYNTFHFSFKFLTISNLFSISLGSFSYNGTVVTLFAYLSICFFFFFIFLSFLKSD